MAQTGPHCARSCAQPSWGPPSAPRPAGATLGLQLSGSAGARLRLGSHPHGRLGTLGPCQAPALHAPSPNCPRESDEATAASKSLRRICPGRLKGAGTRELKGPSLGTAGRERRQAAPVHMHALVCLHASRRAPARSSGAEVCTLGHSSKHTRTRMCGWVAGAYLCTFTQPTTAWGSRHPQALCHVGAGLDHWPCPKHPPSDHPSLRSSPLQGSEGTPRPAVPLRRTGYATPNHSPGNPSLAGSSGSARPDVPACAPGAVKQ